MIFAGSQEEPDLQRAEPDRAGQGVRPRHRRRRDGRGGPAAAGRLPHRRRVEPAHRAGRGAAGGGQPLRRVHPRTGRPRSATGGWGCGWSASWRPRPGASGPRAGGSSCPPGGTPHADGDCTSGPTRRTSSGSSPTVQLGRNVVIHCFANLYGCLVGDETRIGAFVEIQAGAQIGARCKISSHTFICSGRDDRGRGVRRPRGHVHQRPRPAGDHRGRRAADRGRLGADPDPGLPRGVDRQRGGHPGRRHDRRRRPGRGRRGRHPGRRTRGSRRRLPGPVPPPPQLPR